MFDFIKNLEEQSVMPNCQSRGVCTVDPTLSSLKMLIISELRQIAFYVVKAKEFGWENLKIMSKAVSALAIELINTNFCEKEYARELQNLIDIKKEVRKNYLNLCKNNPTSCELISFPIDICTKCSIGKMIKEGEKLIQAKDKFIEQEKTRLIELIVLVAKINAHNIEQIKSFEPDFTDFDFELLRFLSLVSFPTTRVEKFKRRLLEFSNISFRIQAKLISVLKKRYGERRSTRVRHSAKVGKSILVSGSDLSELEQILEMIGDREVNVYTNGPLVVAHTYPKFQKYKNLVGYWGTDSPHSDFANFQGVVFITKNASLKIDNLYRGLIYSTESINPRNVVKIEENNFGPLIEAALSHIGFDEEEEEAFIDLEYNIDKIDEVIKDQQEIVVFVGNSKNVDFSSLIGNKIMVNLECPNEVDLLHHIVKKIRENKVESIVFFTQCNPTIINILMSLLKCDFKEIYLSRCPLATVNPHIIESLELDFDVKIIR